MSARTEVLELGKLQLQGFATELRRRARSWGMVCVRVIPEWDRRNIPYVVVRVWTDRYVEIGLTVQQRQAVVDALYDRRPDIDWGRPHQYNLETGRWSSAPEPHENGFIPSDDRAFGGGDVVFLAKPAKRSADKDAG